MTINVTEIIRKMMGWCPNAAMLNKKEEMYMESYKGGYAEKIKSMGFRGVIGVLNLVFAAWLIITALRVLANPGIFPWWFMDINIISSGVLLLVGISSLMIFLSLVKTANVHKTLALLNIGLLVAFFLYLSQSLLSTDFEYNIFNKPYWGYSFGLVTLVLFTIIISIPSIITLFSKPTGKKKSGYLKAALIIFIVVFASLGGYYLYLNKQKDAMLVGEFGNKGEYKLYKLEPGSASYYDDAHPYFLDSPRDTTGHHISEDTYKAIKFLQNRESGKVLAWWDFELEIKLAGKEPVISYASNAIEFTIARPSSLYDKFEPDEKVADVSRFFTTNSEVVAEDIAEKYGADTVYMWGGQNREYLIQVMIATVSPDLLQNQVIRTPEAYLEKVIKPTMAYKFNTGAEFEYFDKIFENKDVIIYQLKK